MSIPLVSKGGCIPRVTPVWVLILVGLLLSMGRPVWAQSVTATVPVGKEPAGVGVNASTNRIYVANNKKADDDNSGTVSVLQDTVTAAAAKLAIKSGTGATGATLGGTVAVNAVSGIATFSTLSIDKSGVNYQLTASATTLTSADSVTFTVSGAAKLAFTTQPGNASVGSPIPGPPTVTVQRDDGSTESTSTASITLAIVTNPAGGALSGTTGKSATSGVASFTDLSIDKAGRYTLTASATDLTGTTSSAFNVSGGKPTVTIIATTPKAAEAGPVPSTFTVTRTDPTTAALTVNYTVSGTAIPGFNYTAPSGSVTIPVGSTTATITVTPIEDPLAEGDTTVIVTLSANAAYTVGTPNSATVTIAGAGGKPSLGINDVAITKGGTGTANAVFTVTLSSASSQTVTVDFATSNGTATGDSACGGSTDYVTTGGTLTFNAGDTSKTISVKVCGNTLVGPDKTFLANLSNPTNATIADAQGVGIILKVKSADLVIAKSSAPDPLKVGQNLTYTVTVTNNGPAAATGVRFTDTLPQGVSFVSASSGCSQSGSTVTCTIGDLASGATATVTIVVKPTATGTITNTASVTGNQTDPNLTNNTTTQITTVSGGGGAADLSVAIAVTRTRTSNSSSTSTRASQAVVILGNMTAAQGSPKVAVGDILTYTITVANNGPANATGVTLTATLPAEVSFRSATASQGSCSGTSTLTCALGNLAAGASATVTVVATVTVQGKITATVGTAANEADPIPSNNATAVAVNAEVDLFITKTASPDPVTVGSNLTYRITVTNNSPALATGVTLTDTLPSGVTFVSAAASRGSCSGTRALLSATSATCRGPPPLTRRAPRLRSW